jgi:hypothetical protein
METVLLDGEGDTGTSKSINGGIRVRAGTSFSDSIENKELTKKDGISVVFDTIPKSIPFVAESTPSAALVAPVTSELEGTSVRNVVARVEDINSVTDVLVVVVIGTVLDESVELTDSVVNVVLVPMEDSSLVAFVTLPVTATTIPASVLLTPLVGFLVVKVTGGK